MGRRKREQWPDGFYLLGRKKQQPQSGDEDPKNDQKENGPQAGNVGQQSNINIVDSFLQGVPAKQKYIFQPALRRQKPRVNKKCHLPKKQMTLIENSETTFCLRKTLILC